MKPKIEVNFNEIIDDFKILLSQSDMIIDSEGNEILLKEGLEIDIFEPDYDEQNNRMILLQVVLLQNASIHFINK